MSNEETKKNTIQQLNEIELVLPTKKKKQTPPRIGPRGQFVKLSK